MAPALPDLDALARRVTATLGDAWAAVISPKRDAAADAEIAARAAGAAPVVWLLGKVQSGKSSIVRALTGASAAEVGNGFKACTTTASVFDFPADAPAIRFLDTRGLGEASYDPAADIAVAEEQAHLLLLVMKAGDVAQESIIAVAEAARERHPDWPVIVAQTCLHEGYPPGMGHPSPYPFDRAGLPTATLPGELARTMAWQRERIMKLSGRGAIRFVPVDFTQEGDGFEPRLFGLEALRTALLDIAPEAIGAALALDDPAGGRQKRATQHVMGYAGAAAAVDVVPVAGAVAVPAVQAKMLHSLGEIYGVAWDRRMVGELAGALGAGVLTRIATGFGARQLAKLVPVWGQTAGAAAAAAMSFAATFALGKAAIVYLERRSAGGSGVEGVRQAYEEGLRVALGARKSLPPPAPQNRTPDGGTPA
jgi:uncharacterized protein (DUF697 family)